MATGSEPDVWKWIAAVEATILTTLLLGAIPALFWVFRTPSNSEVQIIRDRQQIVLQRLATLDQQVAYNTRAIEQIWVIISQLRLRSDQGGKK